MEFQLDPEELRQKIESECIKRISMMGLKGKKMRDEECAFIAGAMTAIQAIDSRALGISKSIPHEWIVAAIRGQSPFSVKGTK